MVLVTSGSRLLRMFSATARMTSRPVARSWIKATLPVRAPGARRSRPSISGGPNRRSGAVWGRGSVRPVAGELRRRRGTGFQRSGGRHFEHQLAEVLAAEELEQGVGE